MDGDGGDILEVGPNVGQVNPWDRTMSQLTISLLGTVQVLRDGQPVTGQAYAKVLGLLAYLAVEADRPHARASLALLLWPEQPDEKARHSLRQALSTLRRMLDDHVASEPILLITRESVQFRKGGDRLLDVRQLMTLFEACDRHEHPRMETCPACAQRLDVALALYRGDFLQGFAVDDSTEFEDWTTIWRERIRQRVIDASFTAAAWHEGRGALDGAQIAWSRLLELDPWNERAHRGLMEVLWKRGKRGDAIAQYERCRFVLDEELGVEPEQETVALLQRITTQDSPPLESSSTDTRIYQARRLPSPPGRLVGRGRELEEIADVLAHRECRLLTLTGPGGSGKTRLAIEVAASQAGHFQGGLGFVALGTVREPEGIVPAIAAELGLTLPGNVDPEQHLVEWLRNRHVFLVLDNAEHVIEGMPVAGRLLAAASGIKILVTSREVLRLQGEWVYDVDGLAVPSSDSTDSFEGYGSVELLGERLRQVRPRTPMRHEERPVVIRICQLVEGMPLAIELAAAWAHSLTLDEIEGQIRRNLDFLATSLRDVPDRHRSMRAVFNQTWHMLTAGEQAAYRRLSVFRDGFLLQAAGAVADISASDLAALAAKSLLAQQPDGRYRIHGLLRQYGAELMEQGEREYVDIHDRHCRYFLNRLAGYEAALTGDDQRAALDDIEADIGNIRLAWNWAAQRREVGLVTLAAHALWLFHVMRGWMREGAAAFGSMLEALEQGAGDGPQTTETELARAKMLSRHGGFQSGLGRYDVAVAQLSRGAEFLRGLGATRELGLALNMLAAAHHVQGNSQESKHLLQESLACFHEVEDRWGIAFSLNDLGLVSHVLDERGEAERFCEESRRMFRKIGDRRGNAFATYNLGMIAARDGHRERARRLYWESLTLRQDSHDQWGIAASLIQLGTESATLGAPAEARVFLLRALRIAWESSVTPVALDALVGLVALALDSGDDDGAVETLAAVLAHPAARGQLRQQVSSLIQRHSLPIAPSDQPDRWAVKAVDGIVRRRLA